MLAWTIALSVLCTSNAIARTMATTDSPEGKLNHMSREMRSAAISQLKQSRLSSQAFLVCIKGGFFAARKRAELHEITPTRLI